MVFSKDAHVWQRLSAAQREAQISRRAILRLVGGGIGFTAASALMAACGSAPDDGDDDDDDGDDAQNGSGDAESTTEPTSASTSTSEESSSTSEPTEATEEATSTASEEATSTEDEEQPIAGGTLIQAVSTAPIGFDPHTAEASSSMTFYEIVYDRLVEFTPEMEVVPALAESFEVVDDTTYRFSIRQGVTFHNGRELVADDVKYSIDRIMDPELGSPMRPFFSPVESLEVVDDATVVFHLSEPFAPLIGYLTEPSASIVPKEVVEEHGDLKRVMVGTGPFVFDKYETDQAGYFSKFEDHWRDGIPYVDKLELRIIPDERSRMAALEADEVSMARIYEPQNADTLEQDGFNVYRGLSAARALTIINCAREPFNDPKVRLALSYAIDRETFRETALFDEGAVTGFIPAADEAWALPVSEYKSFTQDIEKAKQLLAEAGYPDGFEATLSVSTAYSFDVTNAQVLQGQLQEVGIKINIQQLEWGNLLSTFTDTQDYDLLNIILVFAPDPDGYVYRDFLSDSPINFCGLADEELDKLLIKGRQTPDIEKRKEIYDEIQRKLADELAPYLTYYSYNQYLPAQTYVKGFKTIPSLSRVYIRETWLDKP